MPQPIKIVLLTREFLTFITETVTAWRERVFHVISSIFQRQCCALIAIGVTKKQAFIPSLHLFLLRGTTLPIVKPRNMKFINLYSMSKLAKLMVEKLFGHQPANIVSKLEAFLAMNVPGRPHAKNIVNFKPVFGELFHSWLEI